MSDDTLDWTAPLMLDDGKGTGVELGHVQCWIPGYGLTGYNADGTHVPGTLPRIINRPKEPESDGGDKPVEWGEALTGEEMRALKGIVPDATPVKHGKKSTAFSFWDYSDPDALYRLPSDSPVYAVRDWNAKHPDERPFIPHCGDTCPVDHGARVDALYGDGSVWSDAVASDVIWKNFAIAYRLAEPATESDEGVETDDDGLNIILPSSDTYTDGLRDLANMPHVSSELAGVLRDCADLIDHLQATPTDTVTLPRMTEAEWRVFEDKHWGGPFESIAANCANALGLIKSVKPTPIEQFKQAHPEYADGDDALIAAAIEYGRKS